MFPVSDFNFMVAGIATFAATVGYTYARGKLNYTTEAGPSDNVEMKDEEMSAPQGKDQPNEKRAMEAGPSSANPSVPVRQGSLKRKEPHGGFEEDDTQNLGYPHNLANIYPRKRCRTPSSEEEIGKRKRPVRQFTPLVVEDSPSEDWILVHNINSPNATINEPPRTPSPGAPTPASEVTDSPLLVTTPMPSAEAEDNTSEKATPAAKTKEVDRAATPAAPPSEGCRSQATEESKDEPKPEELSPSAPELSEPKQTAFGKTSTFTPVTSFQKISLQKPITSPFATRGFADFAGNKSRYGAFTTSHVTPQKTGRPVWLAGNGDTSECPGGSEAREEVEEHALAQAKSTMKPLANQVTGEENEDVEMELKGVKLYIKRGDKPFAEGMVGHCKLLKDRTTSDERLLFRREPLWKISMNARMNSSLRCLFDATENALRIITQEPKSDPPNDQKSPEIIVYAMKPGRSCSKQDFKAFSETLITNPQLRPPRSA